MQLLKTTKMLNRFADGELGVIFIETVVALAILGIIAVTFLSGLYTTSKAVIVADKQANAESLARSQMEWVKNADYTDNATEYSLAPLPSGQEYANYSAIIAVEPLHNPDDGIQKIVVTVKHYDEEVTKLRGYKVDR